MGGVAGYARPVEPTDGRISTWRAHTNRGIPSSEPGVDYFCPIGTPIRSAASGVVVDVGTSIMPATGRYITVDLDDGRRVRYLHILRHKVGVGARVRWGEHIADSGATGYGEQDWSWNVAGTGGAHVHMTLFRDHSYRFGRYATLDPEQYMAKNQGGNSAPPRKPIIILKELADMDKAQIVHLVTKTSKTWALVGATVPGGVRTTHSQETANAWAHIYGPSKNTKTQGMFNVVVAEAKALAAAWVAQQKAIHG